MHSSKSVESAAFAAQRFLVRPDEAWHWLAIDMRGPGGGIFVSREAALHDARSESGRRPGAVEVTPRKIALR